MAGLSSARPQEPSLLETFFPIVSAGHHGPSPEEQQAAFNAQFMADFPPVAGVERANPAYSEPPCTPAQIEAIRGHINELRQARAQTAHAQQQMDQQIAVHSANEEPLQQTVATTEAGCTALEQHGDRVQSTAAANEGQQQRQQEVNTTVAQYDDHSGAIDSLRTPLRAFQGMMDLASYLPGEAGQAMQDMNNDATQMLSSFDQMDASMAEQNATGQVCQQQLGDEATQIEGTSTQAQATSETITTANEDAVCLQQQNQEAIADATQRRADAAGATSELDGQIQSQESQAESLSQQLQTWAQAHRAARLSALEATRAKVEENGLCVTAVHTE